MVINLDGCSCARGRLTLVAVIHTTGTMIHGRRIVTSDRGIRRSVIVGHTMVTRGNRTVIVVAAAVVVLTRR